MRPPRPPRPTPPPSSRPLHLPVVVSILCFTAILTSGPATAAVAPAAGDKGGAGGGEGGFIRTRTAAVARFSMAWPSKCKWLPLPNSGRCPSYTLVSKYHKIWKETKQFISAKDVLKKEPVSDVIALKESMKYFDADFFNDSKLREMEDGAKEFNVPAFRENRKLVASKNGGLHNPSVLLFKSSWSSDSTRSETRSFKYPRAPSVHRPTNDEDIAFMSVIELGELIRTKQITSCELTDIFLRRLKRYNPVLEAVVTYTEDLAYKQAKEADDLLAQGKYLELLIAADFHRGPI